MNNFVDITLCDHVIFTKKKKSNLWVNTRPNFVVSKNR